MSVSELANLNVLDPRFLPVHFFTPIIHQKPSPVIDPASNRLPTPFHVCIIGASRGIGAGIATAYAKAGASVLVLAARNIDKLNVIAAEVRAISPLSTTVHIHACDIASATSVKELAEFSKSVLPSSRLDVVVVNSGVTGTVELKITDGDAEQGDWEEVFKTNTLGAYYAAHYFVPILLASPEGSAKSFLAVGTLTSLLTKGVGANPKYGTSKMAQARIVEHVSEQFGEEGLLSVTVHPGGVQTDMSKHASPEALKYMTDDVGLCGAFCVWLTKNYRELKWLNGRLVSACWDPQELLAKKEEVVRGDLLKFELGTSRQT
ncbi:putative short-chain dehydrogenases/reductase [Panus rudis PR-1116 ss-1]|nr:putative short-chain dehydrogenases/reductase [Panus rudis PR-1116 ss-1]